ncbi:MAG: hypothetical protein HXX17_14955 [Geobacteraceae bacterium]|nr:hypothetical protein [Geobacteraceae bacterium]
MTDNAKSEKTLTEKIFSMETLILLAGLFSLGSGFYTGEAIQYFWGGMIITGSVILHFVRKKDWKKHWEEQEAMQRRYEARVKMEQEAKDVEK